MKRAVLWILFAVYSSAWAQASMTGVPKSIQKQMERMPTEDLEALRSSFCCAYWYPGLSDYASDATKYSEGSYCCPLTCCTIKCGEQCREASDRAADARNGNCVTAFGGCIGSLVLSGLALAICPVELILGATGCTSCVPRRLLADNSADYRLDLIRYHAAGTELKRRHKCCGEPSSPVPVLAVAPTLQTFTVHHPQPQHHQAPLPPTPPQGRPCEDASVTSTEIEEM